MSPALWYLLVIVGGALAGFIVGALMDLMERRRWRRELTVDNIIYYKGDKDRGA